MCPNHDSLLLRISSIIDSVTLFCSFSYYSVLYPVSSGDPDHSFEFIGLLKLLVYWFYWLTWYRHAKVLNTQKDLGITALEYQQYMIETYKTLHGF